MYIKKFLYLIYFLFRLSARVIPSRYRSIKHSSIASILCSLKTRNDIYKYFEDYFYLHLPLRFVFHRLYFFMLNKGCGENAFYSFWFYLFKENKFDNVLEIGVYRGQIISLWRLLADYFDYEINIYGVSPFCGTSDTECFYEDDDYYSDVVSIHSLFRQKKPTLIKSYSNMDPGISFIASNSFDCVYIDGDHDYNVVSSDFFSSVKKMSSDGLIIFDDSSLFMDFNYSDRFKGHTGSSMFVSNYVHKKYLFLIGVGHMNCYINRIIN